MESNEAPAHDFAPAWLKLPSSNKSQVHNNDTKVDLDQPLSFRPQYLKKDYSVRQGNAININLSGNNSDHHLLKQSKETNKITNTHHNQQLSPPLNTLDQNSHVPEPTKNIGNGPVTRRSTRRPHIRPDRDVGSFHHSKVGNYYHQQNIEVRSTGSTSDNSSIEETGPQESSNKCSNTNGLADHNTFNKEFPSLVDENAVKEAKNDKSNNVWDGNAKNKVLSTSSKKITLVQRHVTPNENLEGRKSPDGINGSIGSSTYYRAFVPKKKQLTSGINSKEIIGIVNGFGHNSKLMPMFSKPQNLTTSMEILVKNPKTRSCKGSNKFEFLKALRSDDSRSGTDYRFVEETCIENNDDKKNMTEEKFKENGTSDRQKQTECNANGINISKLVIHGHGNDCKTDMQLSSSLEAEQRLLKEMGWKEDDDDDKFYAPLTEDEVKEFKDLILARNGFKRYTNLNHHFQLNWSPKKLMTPFNPMSSPNNDEEDSSSSSDDDADV